VRDRILNKKHLMPERIGKVERAALATALDLDLKALREAAGKTQTEVAPLVAMTQSELSRLERRGDVLLSTLNRYVRALGGHLKVTAEINGKKVIIAEG
jgi:transcriptional regulator with XRE-family HTH domain